MNSKSENTIRITVLMAIYNCSSTLAEALDSLLSQTYQGFKVILCDDCSTDDTYAVAQQYVNKYPEKFILIKNEVNSKLPKSLNNCLQYADTEYVARMDGDDISKPERFEKEIDFLDKHPEYAVVSTAMEYFDESGVFMISKPIERPSQKEFIASSPHAHAPAMIRTSVMKSVGGYTCKRWTQRGQDVYLWAKIYSYGYRGYNLLQPLYSMRDDNNAFKRRSVKEGLLAVIRTYDIYKMMHIPIVYYYTIFRPFIVAIMPRFIYDSFHRSRFKK